MAENSKPLKVFISQPMGGYTLNQIKTIRISIVLYLRMKYEYDEGVEVIDNITINEDYITGKMDRPAMKYFAESIKLMADADLVVFCNGWEDSVGCTLEHDIAQSFNKQILILPIYY